MRTIGEMSRMNTDIITDGIIFDVDGTFWDSTGIVEQAWREALSVAGFPDANVSADVLKGLFGLPMHDILTAILPGVPDEVLEQIAPSVYKYEDDFLRRKPPVPYEGLPEMIKILAKKIPLFVVSNCQAGYIELFCDATGLGPYFKDHLCPGDTGMLKADNIRKIIDDYGLKAPVYVGDTIMDADACSAAACPFVYAAYGFGEVSNPDYVINSPMELVDMIK